MSEEPVRTYEKRIPVIIFGEFAVICDEDGCQAALLNHILYWIHHNRKEGRAHYYATGEELQRAMREWSVNIVRRSVNALIARGFIGETTSPTHGYDRTKHFYFEEPQARALLTALLAYGICPLCDDRPQVLRDAFTPHLPNLLHGLTISGRSIYQICEIHLDVSGRPITKITTKITDKERASLSGEEKGVEGTYRNEIPPGEEARPPNTRQQRALDTQFEEAVWSLWTARIGHKINVAARRKPGNYEGLVVLRDYSLPDIELALKRASTFTVQSTNMSNLAKDIDGLLGNSQQVKELTQQQLAKNGHRPPRDLSYAHELRRSWTHKERNLKGNGEHTPT